MAPAETTVCLEQARSSLAQLKESIRALAVDPGAPTARTPPCERDTGRASRAPWQGCPMKLRAQGGGGAGSCSAGRRS